MTTTEFEYEEPATIPMTAANAAEASSLADDPAVAALSMINNGPAVPAGDNTESPSLADNQDGELGEPGDGASINQEEDSPDESVESSDDEPIPYTDEEYAELCRQVDEDYALELQRLETEFAEAGIERAKQADTLKDAKQSEKLALDVMREFIAKGPKYPPKTRPKNPARSNQGDGSSADGATADDAAAGSLSPHSDVPYADPDNLVATTPEHEEYYNTPTSSLLAGIDGLGKAKMERLVECAPTCRDLQRLNIQAGRYHHGDISELLPQGFGKALGERIIERLSDKMPFVAPKS